jgi:CheY-like chemotaxis protein
LLDEELAGNSSARELLEIALRAVKAGGSLTGSLLAFSRQQPLKPRTINADDLIGETAQLISRTLPASITLRLALAAKHECEVDPGQLQNALLNLVLNAQDAMPRGGELVIRTEDVTGRTDLAPGNYVLISVYDTGHGMSPDVLARAIEPFFTTKEVGQGTGLGLSSVYGFVSQSNGVLKIDSTRGQGTTVNIYLPRSKSMPLPADPASHSPCNAGNCSILVVEDDEDLLGLVTIMLQALGYTIFTASDGRAALVTLRSGQHKINLLLTDIMLPGGMNGRDLSEIARHEFPDLNVVYMSGYSEDALIHCGRLDPGIVLLQKPFEKDELVSTIRKTLQARTTP